MNGDRKCVPDTVCTAICMCLCSESQPSYFFLSHHISHHNLHWSNEVMSNSSREWTKEEDALLRDAVSQYRGNDWKRISSSLNNRSDIQCYDRWSEISNNIQIKGAWSPEEDALVLELVKIHGAKKWSLIAQYLTRTGKQCRERWLNHLNPHVTKGEWTEEEDRAILLSHQINGNKWAILAAQLRGR